MRILRTLLVVRCQVKINSSFCRLAASMTIFSCSGGPLAFLANGNFITLLFPSNRRNALSLHSQLYLKHFRPKFYAVSTFFFAPITQSEISAFDSGSICVIIIIGASSAKYETACIRHSCTVPFVTMVTSAVANLEGADTSGRSRVWKVGFMRTGVDPGGGL